METTKNPVNAGGRNAQGGTDKIGRDIGGIVDDAAELLKDYGTEKFDTAKATLAQAHAAVSDGAKRYARATDGYVHENPWIALGVAAAAGLLIGALLARR